jgi:hypothetical protein
VKQEQISEFWVGIVATHAQCTIGVVNVYIPPTTSAHAPHSYQAVLGAITDWTAAARVAAGGVDYVIVCGDFNARAGTLISGQAQDRIEDGRGRQMVTAMQESGLSPLATEEALSGTPSPHTFFGGGVPTSTLDYVWVQVGHRVGAERIEGRCSVIGDVGDTSDHALLKGSLVVPGELFGQLPKNVAVPTSRPNRVLMTATGAQAINNDRGGG